MRPIEWGQPTPVHGVKNIQYIGFNLDTIFSWANNRHAMRLCTDLICELVIENQHISAQNHIVFNRSIIYSPLSTRHVTLHTKTRIYLYSVSGCKLQIALKWYINRTVISLRWAIMTWVSWLLKSQTTGSFVQQLFRLTTKKKFPGYWWPMVSPHRGPVIRKAFLYDATIGTM